METSVKNVAQGLQKLLASNYTLYLKTQNYHWNVTGPRFFSLHMFLEKQYEALAEANDEIAERIRVLGEFAAGSFKEFSELTFIKEAGKEHIAAEAMVKSQLEDYQTLVNFMKELIKKASEDEDEATVDLLVGQVKAHEKTIWMLRSFSS